MTNKKRKILAIIPARGGSKSIPKKNLVMLAGQPLIAWTIQAAQKSKMFDKIAVSSDSKEILEVSRIYKAIPLLRPKKLATKNAKAEPVIKHALKTLKRSGFEPDIIVYLQPTSPLRTAKHIKLAFKSFFQRNTDAVVSVSDLSNKVLKAYIQDKTGNLMAISDEKFLFANRQDLPKTFIPNGAIYIIYRRTFLRSGKLLGKNTKPYIMDEKDSLDLDTKQQIPALEKIMKKW